MPRPHRDARGRARAHRGDPRRGGAPAARRPHPGDQGPRRLPPRVRRHERGRRRRLRERKHRRGKPLAVMVRDLEMARAARRGRSRRRAAPERDGPPDRAAEGTPITAAVASGDAGPRSELAGVFIVRRWTLRGQRPKSRATPRAVTLAPRSPLTEVGVMLPYTPLQHILLHDLGIPLVMTSGNLSEEPIATGNAEALDRLCRHRGCSDKTGTLTEGIVKVQRPWMGKAIPLTR